MVEPDKPRSRLKIYLDILTTIKGEQNAKPTRILYKANLSYERLTKYMEEMVSKGLIDEKKDGENRYYVMTPKGVEFLNEVTRAEAFVTGFGVKI
jgi:predicted transcriptional regulator